MTSCLFTILRGQRRRIPRGQRLCIPRGQRLWEAISLISHRRLSELLVPDADGRPVGLLDITDVIALGGKRSGSADDPDPAELKRPEARLSPPAC